MRLISAGSCASVVKGKIMALLRDRAPDLLKPLLQLPSFPPLSSVQADVQASCKGTSRYFSVTLHQTGSSNCCRCPNAHTPFSCVGGSASVPEGEIVVCLFEGGKSMQLAQATEILNRPILLICAGGSASMPEGDIVVRLFEGATGPTRLAQATKTPN